VPQSALPRLGGIVIDARVMAFLPRLVACLDAADSASCRRCASAGPRVAKALALHAGETRTTSDRQGERLRTLLVAGQIAMDARPSDRRGPADSQLRASHVGVARLRIERGARASCRPSE